jgi:hypothetical protein
MGRILRARDLADNLDRWIGIALLVGLCVVGLLRRIW